MQQSEKMISMITWVCFVSVVNSFYLSPCYDKYSVYTGATIYTVDSNDWDTKPASVMVVNNVNGRIEFIGDYRELAMNDVFECLTDMDDVYNMTGLVILPGFHDVHMHPLEANLDIGKSCLLEPDTPPEFLKDTIADCVPNDHVNNDDDVCSSNWIIGHGHSIEPILEHIKHNKEDPRFIIDDVIDDIPVVIMEETSHSVWVNSVALECAGINKNTPNIVGGIIMKNEKTQEPNGILLENAGIEIMDQAINSIPDIDKLNYDALLVGLESLRKNGITSVCDARTYWKRGYHNTWKRACDEDELTARVKLGLWAYPNMNDYEQILNLNQLYTENYSDRCFLKINEIKVYSDGLLTTTTAAMLKPYVKNLHLQGLTENKGMNYFTEERLGEYLTQLQSSQNSDGFDFHIHAIGDRGVREVLNAINNSYNHYTRHRMTHLEVINPSDVKRFKKLNVVADFQVSGEFTLPRERHRIDAEIGNQRAEDFIPVRSVAETGAKITLSSDWDVSTLNPFVGIQNAAQRGHQSISVKSAVEMHTIHAAYAMRQENIVGSLTVGKEADFIVIDQDILKINKNSIHQTTVMGTLFRGKLIYLSKKRFQ